MLSVQGLTVSLSGKTIIEDINFQVRPGEWLMLVGPNGAGKSTLLNAITQGIPYEGVVTYGGENLRGMKPRVRARHLALLSQRHQVGYAFTAEEVIRLGRYAAATMFGTPSAEDERLTQEAIDTAGVRHLLKQSVLTLSGGELQRVFLAQVLAQNPSLLLLDEPSNHLDLKYQQQTMQVISQWLKQPGRAVVSVVHDLSLARVYGTRAVLLYRGRVLMDGLVDQVLSTGPLTQAYQMDVPAYIRQLLGAWGDDPAAD